jgi:hypothetical protein
VPFPLRSITAPAMLIAHQQLETRRSYADSRPQATDSSEASHRPGLRILTFRNIILRVGESTDRDKYHPNHTYLRAQACTQSSHACSTSPRP